MISMAGETVPRARFLSRLTEPDSTPRYRRRRAGRERCPKARGHTTAIAFAILLPLCYPTDLTIAEAVRTTLA